MAKEFIEPKNEANLETDGIIVVSWYHRDKFEKSKDNKFKCSNCGNCYNHKHVYELPNEKIIGLCYSCQKKVHNMNTLNSKFRKF